MMTRAAQASDDDPFRAALRGRLAASGLPGVWARRERCVVLELGFDDGIGLLAARDAWRSDPDRGAALHWVSWLPAPVPRDAIAARLAALRVPDATRRAILAAWPPALDGVHRLPLDGGRCVLTLAVGDPRRMLAGAVPRADALVIGVDPDTSPLPASTLRAAASMLADEGRAGIALLARAYRPRVGPPFEDDGAAPLRRPALDATLRALEDAGLRVESAAHGAWSARRVRGRGAGPSSVAAPGGRRALVVGSGLAGAASAAALLRRGWSVTRIDGLAPRGSAQPVLAQHPSLTPDDAPLSRLTRAATLLSRVDPVLSAVLRPHGRVQLADAERAQAVCARLPQDWAEPIDAAQASARAGVALRRGGWWLPWAGSADPDALREAWSDGRLDRRTGVDVSCLVRRGDRWAALDTGGATLADAPVAVLAPGSHPVRLRLADDMPPGELAPQLGPAGLHRRAGLTTVATLPAGAVPRCTVGGDGHAVPVDATRLLLGPPGTPEDDDVSDTTDDDTADRAWARWAASLAAPPPSPRLGPGLRGERLSTRDHLPLVGPVPDLAAIDALRRAGAARDDRLALPALDGLWLVGAFGGRGLLWSVLAAELIASRLDGEPAPLERDLARRLEPDRFLRRALRRPDTSD